MTKIDRVRRVLGVMNSAARKSAIALGIAVFLAAPTAAQAQAGDKLLPLRLAPRLTAVNSAPALPEQVRALEGQTAGYLFDRDTTTEHTAYGPSSVVVELDGVQRFDRLKVFGAAPYAVSVDADISGRWTAVSGLQNLDLRQLTEQWHGFAASNGVSTSRLRLSLEPKEGAAATGLREVEFWGAGARLAISSPEMLLLALDQKAAPLHVREYPLTPKQGSIGTVGDDDPADNTFSFDLNRRPSDFRRAYLVYELYGLEHWTAAVRSLNGNTVRGGWASAVSGNWLRQIEPISVEALVAGRNTVVFSAPQGVRPYSVRDVRVIAELADGSNFIASISADRPDSQSNQLAWLRDGNADTGWAPYSGSDKPVLEVRFDRTAELDGLDLLLAYSLGGQINIDALRDGRWQNVAGGQVSGKDLKSGWNRISLAKAGAIAGLRLTFTGGAGSSGELRELAAVGSETGPRYNPPRIDLSYPANGEYRDNRAYLRGFVQPADNGSGPAKLTIAGRSVPHANGEFDAQVTTEEAGYERHALGQPWKVEIKVVYPDGQSFTRTVRLDNPQPAVNSDGTLEVAPPYSERIPPGLQKKLRYDGAELDIGVSALDKAATIQIRPLSKHELPALDTGMTNVTRGPRAGYRFLPHGQKFKNKVAVRLPYSAGAIPPGHRPDDIHTFYYDEELARWVPLERAHVDVARGEVVSYTDHFTDMINATVTVPDHPNPASFDGNTIKGIKAADPGAGINLIEPPSANNTGDARLSYPIELPPGRAGLTPQLAINYNSGGGNGWLGIGWDLASESVSIDTRWGAPRYSEDKETETYLLNGEMLTPVAHRGEPVAREAKRRFHARVEGSFRRIIRHGDSPQSYWWEVTDKNGTRYFYGGTPESGQQTGAILKDGKGNVFRWLLTEVRDSNSNNMKYGYELVPDTGTGNGTDGVAGQQRYLKTIHYTGHKGEPGPYSVEFKRDRDLGEPRRKDVQIDARGGFKMVTADLLRRIEVSHGSKPVRAYELTYAASPFGKSLLTAAIQYGANGSEFNRHTFEYFDEVPADAGGNGFNVFAGQLQKATTADDGLQQKLLKQKTFNYPMIGGTYGRNRGSSGYFGIGVPLLGTEAAAIGKFSSNSSESEGTVALQDIDGDGLPDKVFLKNGRISYRKNLTQPGDEQLTFGELKHVDGLSQMSRNKSDSSTTGADGYAFGATGFRQKITTTNTDKAYFADVNGDGIIDHVNNGLVRFGYRDLSGSEPKITFGSDSSATPSPIDGGAMATEGLFDALIKDAEVLKDQNPLLDAVRRWQAPYDGTVRIEGTVQLYDYSKDPDEEVAKERQRYETADGVVLAIQKNNDEYWRAVLGPNDHKRYAYHQLKNIAATPKRLSRINVKRGDEIYFRVGSLDDGSYDRVDWSPRVVYIDGKGQPKQFLDANNLNIYRYDAGEDTIFAGTPVNLVAPYDGTIRFTGSLTKPVTTDDITVAIEIYEFDEESESFAAQPKTGAGGSFSKKLPWDSQIELPIAADFDVKTGDRIVINFAVDSPIDLRAIQWSVAPQMYYTKATQRGISLVEPPEEEDPPNPEDPLPEDNSDLRDLDTDGMVPGGELPVQEIPVVDADGKHLIELPVRYNADIYSADDLEGKPQGAWTAERDGFLLLTTWVAVVGRDDICKLRPHYWWRNMCKSIEPTPDGELTFTIKRRGERLHKSVIQVRDEQVVASQNGYETLAAIPVKAGDELFFDFSSRDIMLLPRLAFANVRLEYGSDTPWVVPLTDTVTVAATARASDSRSNEFGVPDSHPSTAVVLIRRDGTILERRQVRVPAGGVWALREDFTLPVTEGERLYFDFLTAEDHLHISDATAWTRYAGAGPWSAPREGTVAITPVLTYKPGTVPNGDLLLKVFRNGNAVGQREYVVKDGTLSNKGATGTPAEPLILAVNKGNELRYELWTQSHVLSSTLADKGQVSIDYRDHAAWTVPMTWQSADPAVPAVPIEVRPTLAFDFQGKRPDGEVLFSVKRGGVLLAQEAYRVEAGQLRLPLKPIRLDVNGGDQLEFIFSEAGGALMPYVAAHGVNVIFNGNAHPAASVFNAQDILQPVSSLHILMPRKAQVLPLQESVLHFPEWDLLYGNPYRGWGQAAYVAAGDLANVALDEDLLKISEEEKDHEDLRSDVYPAMPAFQKSRWESVDDAWAVAPGYITSTRRGLKYIEVPKVKDFERDPSSARTAGIIRVPRNSFSQGYSDGGGYILTRSRTWTTTDGRLDLIDLNGDRYPDIVSSGRVQYTLPDGSMAPLGEGLGVDAVRQTRISDSSLSYGGGTQPPTNARARLEAARTSPPEPQKSSPKISAGGSFGKGDSDGIVDFIDMNGDGLPDRVSISGGVIHVELNLGYGFAPSEVWGSGYANKGETRTYAFNAGWSHPGSIFSGGLNLNLSTNDVTGRLLDVNGDGLPDYVYVDDGGLKVSLNEGGRLSDNAIAIGRPLKTIEDVSSLGAYGGTSKIAKSHYSLSDGLSTSLSASVNGAGKTTITAGPIPVMDLVYGGGGNYGETMSQPTVAFMDINGDGYLDSVRSGQGSELEVMLNQIGRTHLLRQVKRPLGAIITLDYQRDGNSYELPHSRWNLSQVKVFDGHVGDGVDTMLTEFRYSKPNYDRFEREFYGYGEVRTEQRNPARKNALYRETVQTYRTDSFYSKGLLASERLLDAGGRPYTETVQTYQLYDVLAGKPYDLREEQLRDPSRSPATVFPQLTRKERRFYEGQSSAGKTTYETYAYDAYGNVVEFEDAGDVGPDDDIQAKIAYHEDLSAYIVGKAKSISVIGANKEMRRREADFLPTTGNMSKVREYLLDASGSAAKYGAIAVTELGYDRFGNLTKIKGPQNYQNQHYTINLAYDDIVDTHIVSIRDSFGYESKVKHDYSFGLPTLTTDINGNQTLFVYDAFGRTERVYGPYQMAHGKPTDPQRPTIRFAYHPHAAVPWALTQHLDRFRDASDPIETVLFVDGLKRVLQTKKDATIHTGSGPRDLMIVSGAVRYDFVGRVVKQYYPITEPLGRQGQFNRTRDSVRATVTTYDVLDRTTLVTLPDLTHIKMAYEIGSDGSGPARFVTAVTDDLGRTKTSYRDVRELITAVRERNAGQDLWTRYRYDPLKQITEVIDAAGHITRVGYDSLGRRTVIDNPDMGRTESVYDLAGNLVEKITAKLRAQGAAIRYRYDYNRLTAIDYPAYPDNNVRYEYGPPGAAHNRAGRISQIRDASGAQVLSYGPLGEIVREVRTLVSPATGEGPREYTTEYLYDSFGRLQALVYPDGEALRYGYNAGGQVQSAVGVKAGVATPYLRYLGYDKFEQRVRLESGNGVVTDYTYRADNRRLSRLVAGTPGAAPFQNLAYGYDRVGNITSLSNQVAIPKPGGYGGPVTQTFDYDDLDRLTSASGEWNYAPNQRESYELAMRYDGIHNITHKTQTHVRVPPGGREVVQAKTSYDWAYAYTGTQPHAPTQIGTRRFSYDANGNQTGWTSDANGTRRTLVWDEENRLRSVADNGRTQRYVYDATGERVVKWTAQGETAYVNRYFTVRNGTLASKHVFAGTTRLSSTLVPGLAHLAPGSGRVGGSGNQAAQNALRNPAFHSKFGGAHPGLGRVNRSAQGAANAQDVHKNPHFVDGANPPAEPPPGEPPAPGTPGQPEDNFRYYYHPDHLGSSSYVTDGAGQLYEHLQYFPFGETWVEQASNRWRTPYRFTGKELDEETGLYYFGARYYDPRTSVWQSVDPILDQYLDGNPNQGVFSPINLNLTRYAGLNPVRITDPTGMSDCPECDEVMASRQKFLDRVESVKEGMSTAGDVLEAAAPAPGAAVLGVATKGNKIWNAISKLFGSKGDDFAKAATKVPGRVQSRINISNDGMKHTLSGHLNPVRAGNKSQFTIPESELRSLLSAKSTVNAPVTALDTGNFARTITLDRPVGNLAEKMGGGPTNTFTVITDKFGNLQTAFPGGL